MKTENKKQSLLYQDGAGSKEGSYFLSKSLLAKLSEPRRQCWRASASGKKGMHTTHLHSLDPGAPKAAQCNINIKFTDHWAQEEERRQHPCAKVTGKINKHPIRRVWRSLEGVNSWSGLMKRQTQICDWLLVSHTGNICWVWRWTNNPSTCQVKIERCQG